MSFTIKGVLEYGSIKMQNASESIQGTYQLGINGSWTDPIDYFADANYVSQNSSYLVWTSNGKFYGVSIIVMHVVQKNMQIFSYYRFL